MHEGTASYGIGSHGVECTVKRVGSQFVAAEAKIASFGRSSLFLDDFFLDRDPEIISTLEITSANLMDISDAGRGDIVADGVDLLHVVEFGHSGSTWKMSRRRGSVGVQTLKLRSWSLW